MDFIEGLPLYGAFESILVVVDCLSKYGHFVALQHPFSAHSMASIFVRVVIFHTRKCMRREQVIKW